MDLLLQDSTLINSFTDKTERAEALQDCKDRFESIYETYTNTTQPTEAMMEKVIDMYLFLGIEPSAKLMEDVKKFLLEGKTFSKLDIYMHLPEYDQVVKLLRPEYYAEVDPRRFNQFTVNTLIYNLASASYTIQDSYENAYSIWYIKYLLGKAVVLTNTHILNMIENKTPIDCIIYIYELALRNWCDAITDEVHMPYIRASYITNLETFTIKVNNVDFLKYLINKHGYNALMYKALKKYHRPEITNYLGPFADINPDDMDYIVKNKDINMLRKMAEIIPKNISFLKYDIIRNRWREGYEAIADVLNHNVELLYQIYVYLPEYFEKTYNLVLKQNSQEKILGCAIFYDNFTFFKKIHSYNPVCLKFLELNRFSNIEELIYYVNHGYVVKISDLMIAMHWYKDMVPYLIYQYYRHNDNTYSERIMTSAVNRDLRNVISYLLDTKRCALSKRLIKITIQLGNADLCEWLVRRGCPVSKKDKRNIPTYICDLYEQRDR